MGYNMGKRPAIWLVCTIALMLNACVQGKAPGNKILALFNLNPAERAVGIPLAVTIVAGETVYVSSNFGARNQAPVLWKANVTGSYQLRQSQSCSSGTVLESGEYSTKDTQKQYDVSAATSAAGTSSIIVCVTDSTGATYSKSIYVVHDDTPPVAVVTPGSGAYGSSPSVELTCTDLGGSDCGPGAYEINADPSINFDGSVLTGTAYQSAITPNDPATTNYHFQILDRAGNKSNVLVANYTVDSRLPVITISQKDPPTWPLAGPGTGYGLKFKSSVPGTAFLRTGGSSCTDPASTLVDSAFVVGNTNTIFSEDASTTLTAGSNTLRLCVQNAGGLMAETSLSVTYDDAPPTVSSVSPATPPSKMDPENAKFIINFNEPVSIDTIGVSMSSSLQGGSLEYQMLTQISPQSVQFQFHPIENANFHLEIVASDSVGNVMPTIPIATFQTGMMQKRRYKTTGTSQTSCRNPSGSLISCALTGQNGEFPDNPEPMQISMPWSDPGSPSEYIVTDATTGLQWIACPFGQVSNGINCSGFAPSNSDLTGAAYHCSELNGYNSGIIVPGGTYGNLSGWRLPTIGEMYTIMSFAENVGSENRLHPAFIGSSLDQYWTSSAVGTASGFGVNLNRTGMIEQVPVATGRAIFCVRDPNPATVPATFPDNGDGTVTDPLNGTIWQKCAVGQSASDCSVGSVALMDWGTAQNACRNLSLAGRTWRVPTIKELISIADFGASSAPFVYPAFPNSNGIYWSSTGRVDGVSTFEDREQLVFQSVDGTVTGITRQNGLGSAAVRCVSGP